MAVMLFRRGDGFGGVFEMHLCAQSALISGYCCAVPVCIIASITMDVNATLKLLLGAVMSVGKQVE